ncbi:phosphate signaling complex protein PhoU [Halovivax gelatinilyticus]|uniref:phosphate signaling complex protein PhoU n=1 Tax=Halovivax gelatinilyticus TaxID=2961597 RepID=UPI0020CA2A88|nr:phosphate signaling complex protein PhoU [Halovivax gelatinilyticus]
MARKSYQAELDALEAGVLEMSDLVCERFRLALSAYEQRDEELAEGVITGDHEINRRYLELEGECIGLLALQQPVAGDLRFITASFKIITDLERVADLATNVGRYAIEGGRDRYPEIPVVQIGETTIELVEDAMSAYATNDAAATYEIATRDDDIDARCESASEVVVRDVLASGAAVGEATDGTGDVSPLFEDVSRMLLTIRDVERVGDHAVNIAARTLNMVENDDELIY